MGLPAAAGPRVLEPAAHVLRLQLRQDADVHELYVGSVLQAAAADSVHAGRECVGAIHTGHIGPDHILGNSAVRAGGAAALLYDADVASNDDAIDNFGSNSINSVGFDNVDHICDGLDWFH